MTITSLHRLGPCERLCASFFRGLTFEAQHVTAQIRDVLIRERELRHDGSWRHRLRFAKMAEMPLPIRPFIGHIREIGADLATFAMNLDGRPHSGSGHTAPSPPRDRRVRFSESRVNSTTKSRATQTRPGGRPSRGRAAIGRATRPPFQVAVYQRPQQQSQDE